MKRIKCLLIITVVLFSSGLTLSADVKPNSLFTDNAVLQQGISVPVWGTADKGEEVTVRVQNQKVSDICEDGTWMVRLKPLKAGGPFVMTISGKNTVELKNILVGEVWVCSGQSNMQWPLRPTDNGEKDVAASADPMMRLFTVPMLPAETPQTEVAAAWQECNPQTSPDFSAVAYFFGRELRKTLDVPVGLINTSYGGTIVEAWTSAKTLVPDPNWVKAIIEQKDWQKLPNRPSVLYNAMIAPLIPYAMRGAIWYQGEGNAGQAFKYRKMFPDLITDWRKNWGQGEFPFFFVQLAPFMDIVSEPQESAWAELREAQLLTSINCPNTGMAVITDAGDPKDIHPRKKEPVGQRLAYAALAMTYGKPVAYKGPMYKSMMVRGNRAILTFDSVGSGLEAKGGDLTGFTIAGEDHKFYNAKATIVGDRIVVSSDQVSKPTAVRYGWANCPVVNLYNKDGLPASPFRTDDFPMVTNPVKQ